MSYDEELAALAAACGIEDGYWDIWGSYHPTSTYTRQALLAAMRLPIEQIAHDPAQLRAELQQDEVPPAQIPALPSAYLPTPIAQGRRLWGVNVQLYGLRSRRNWGIGDFGDLACLCRLVARAGGSFVGLNPLHALFPEQPQRASPYSPSHRRFLNVLYLDIEAIPEFATSDEARRHVASAAFQRRLEALRDAPFVDYAGVAAAKMEVLPLLWATFQKGPSERRRAFEKWRTSEGETLARFALFSALQTYFHRQDPQRYWGFPAWPAAYQDPDSPAVSEFAREHTDAIAFHAWLQWLAETQLRAAEAAGQESGLSLGLYLDLAVGASPGGGEVWAQPSVFAHGASAGAPPDELNLLGQDWGLPPYIPQRLLSRRCHPFEILLAANMREGGMLRIDHVMMLTRLFWVPQGIAAIEGAYVRYPFAALLASLCKISQERRCLVIGEDLGTVPAGFREKMREANVFSYRPLIFERDGDGQFRLPEAMPEKALVAASTHDLPTLQGFWLGHDLRLRDQLGLFPNENTRERLYREREWDRGRLLWALERTGLLPAGIGKDPAQIPALPTTVIAAIHAYLARSRAQLFAVAAEDLFAVVEQTNVPGTTEAQQPNWRRKLPAPIEEWDTDERVQAIFSAIRHERP